MLAIISPRDHRYLKYKTNDEILDRSKQLVNTYCDRDNAYNPKFDDNNKKHKSDKRVDIGSMIKTFRKHDKVRRIKEENDKLTRIENDLYYS